MGGIPNSVAGLRIVLKAHTLNGPHRPRRSQPDSCRAQSARRRCGDEAPFPTGTATRECGAEAKRHNRPVGRVPTGGHAEEAVAAQQRIDDLLCRDQQQCQSARLQARALQRSCPWTSRAGCVTQSLRNPRFRVSVSDRCRPPAASRRSRRRRDCALGSDHVASSRKIPSASQSKALHERSSSHRRTLHLPALAVRVRAPAGRLDQRHAALRLGDSVACAGPPADLETGNTDNAAAVCGASRFRMSIGGPLSVGQVPGSSLTNCPSQRCPAPRCSLRPAGAQNRRHRRIRRRQAFRAAASNLHRDPRHSQAQPRGHRRRRAEAPARRLHGREPERQLVARVRYDPHRGATQLVETSARTPAAGWPNSPRRSRRQSVPPPGFPVRMCCAMSLRYLEGEGRAAQPVRVLDVRGRRLERLAHARRAP